MNKKRNKQCDDCSLDECVVSCFNDHPGSRVARRKYFYASMVVGPHYEDQTLS